MNNDAIEQLEQVKCRALDVLDKQPELQHAVVVSFLGAMQAAARYEPEAMAEAAKVMGVALENFESGGLFAQ